MEELIVSEHVDSAEENLRNNVQTVFESVGELKDKLIQVAAVAYGSGATEGANGGEGHIGVVGGKVVKFNTKKAEYRNEAYKQSEHYEAMLESSSKFRERVMELASATLQAHMTRAFDELGGRLVEVKNGKVDEKVENQIEKTHNDIIAKTQDLKAKGRVMFTRKDAAEWVTFICRSVKAFTGMDIENEVWGAAKKLAKKSHGDTQAQFAQAVEFQRKVTDMKTERNIAGKVVAAATAAAKSSEVVDGVEMTPPRVTGSAESGTRCSFDDYSSNQKFFYAKKTASAVDHSDALRYDRLYRIHNAISAMVDTTIDNLPRNCGVEELLSYRMPPGARRKTNKFAADEFLRRMGKYERENVLIEAGRKGFKGMSEKNYTHILTKLRDHFYSIAKKTGPIAAGTDPHKDVPQAIARELCWRIVLFLDEQISQSGMRITNRYTWEKSDNNPNQDINQIPRNELDAFWKRNLALDFNRPLGGQDYEGHHFWNNSYHNGEIIV